MVDRQYFHTTLPWNSSGVLRRAKPAPAETVAPPFALKRSVGNLTVPMKPARTVIVIGLDGLEPKIVESLLSRGELPHLQSLAEVGGYSRVTTTYPAQTPVAWSTFATGTNPGGHGIFGFSELKPGSYDLRFTNFKDLKAPPLWDKLRDAGKRSVIINLPGTYPARPVNGGRKG